MIGTFLQYFMLTSLLHAFERQLEVYSSHKGESCTYKFCNQLPAYTAHRGFLHQTFSGIQKVKKSVYRILKVWACLMNELRKSFFDCIYFSIKRYWSFIWKTFSFSLFLVLEADIVFSSTLAQSWAQSFHAVAAVLGDQMYCPCFDCIHVTMW